MTFQDIKIGKDSITWGDDIMDSYTCLWFPKNGYFRRRTEQRVLPHAVGCQSPMAKSKYESILKGTTKIYMNQICQTSLPSLIVNILDKRDARLFENSGSI